MKSIQARLQSRIAKRSTRITSIQQDRFMARLNGDYTYMHACDDALEDLREDQKLDKDLLSNVYWR